MNVAVLASGSKGNATLVDAGAAKILIDAGVGIRRLTKELRKVGVAPGEITAIFITHEHSDHVSGLEALLKHTDADVYTRPATYERIWEKCPPLRYRAIHDRVALPGGARVRAFDVPHDAAETVGYSVTSGEGGEKCVVATDLGCVTEAVQRELENAATVVLEANHDLAMLKCGEYPWPLKQRILGRRGHLSNRDTAAALANLRTMPRRVLLAHISQHNNTPQLALGTVADLLAQAGRLVPLAATNQDYLVR